MPNFAKAVLVAMVTLFITIAGIDHYIHRDLDINFAKNLPTSFSICGEEIGSDSEQYTRLVDWLNENDEGWKTTMASYVPSYEYSSEKLQISVFPTGVIVNFENEGAWAQVTLSSNTETIIGECSSAYI
jgi:hypothetical protein